MGDSGGREVPQALHGDGHHTYRCYLRGPDGVHELPTRGPGARSKATRIREPSSTGAPGVRYVLYLDLVSPYHHPDRVEAVGGATPAVLVNPPSRRRHDQPPLGAPDRLQWRTPRRGRPGLHLHEGDNTSLRHHQIDLPGSGAVVSGQHLPAARLQMSGRYPLAPSPMSPPLRSGLRLHGLQGGQAPWA